MQDTLSSMLFIESEGNNQAMIHGFDEIMALLYLNHNLSPNLWAFKLLAQPSTGKSDLTASFLPLQSMTRKGEFTSL